MTRNSSGILGFLIYLTLVSLSYGVPLSGSNVRNVRPREFSFVASIVSRDANGQRKHYCTGTFVSRRSVLTAGHCVVKKNIAQVEIIGILDNTYEVYHPESWIAFPQWKNRDAPDEYSSDDIAMITTREIVNNPRIIPAIVSLTVAPNVHHARVRIVSSGHGEDVRRPLIVKTGLMVSMNNQECTTKGIRLTGNTHFIVRPNYFCTDADQRVISVCGDSGSPILNHQMQVIGIHTAVCPALKGYSEEFQNQHQLKKHLIVYQYGHFIRSTMR